MNTKPEETQSSSTPPPTTTTTDQSQPKPPPASSSTPPPPQTTTTTDQSQPPAPPSAQPSSSSDQNTEKWGTHIMGAPAPPSSHPNNQKAATWNSEDYHQPQQPYVQYTPVDHKSPMEPVVNAFNTWSSKAESLARNIWKNLKTGPSLSDTVYGKVGLTTKVLTGGGFEALYKQTFVTDPNEKLKKTFACYFSTSTGPVAGTLYLSNLHIAFCSDRPLSFTAPSGQVAWSYYKVVVPLAKISTINPIITHEIPSEKYIQITTVDGHDFWFMGFVNYDKAELHLSQSFREFIANVAQPGVSYPTVFG